LLKLQFVKIVNYGSSAYDQIIGDVAACNFNVLVDVCMSHCSGVATYTHQQGHYQYMQPHHH